MRLHHLEITAFGPFTDTVRVDFDRLSDAGLFLLSGPTGAGKTSVLDAVCFALYGDVPGDRSTAKRLRSDRAAADTGTRVVLEATLAGRRLRLTRSPAWERPKKRGAGTTTQQASVVVMERVRGEWITHTTRLDEAGHLVADLLGMNLTQFTQVAMLPQGRFQAFLRARSEERKELLQRLFRTERFTDVERWLRERRVALRRRSETRHQLVADVLSRTSESTGVAIPADWDLHDLAIPAGDGSLLAWVGDLVDDARTEQRLAGETAGAAVEAEAAAREALDHGRSLAERRARVEAARIEHTELEAGQPQHDADVAAVEAARRAASVLPVHALHQRASRAHAGALAAAPVGAQRPFLAAEVERLTDGLAAARALMPREQRRHVVATDLEAARARTAELAAALAAGDERAAALPALIAAAETDCESARAAAGVVERLSAVVAAQAEADRLTVAVGEARERHRAAVDLAQEMRTRVLDVRQARLESMAAELAGALAVGGSCPVCGSCEHPHKASPAADSPDAEAERTAQKDYDDAKSAEHLRDVELRELSFLLEQARTVAAGAGSTDAQQALVDAAALADTLPRHQATLAELRDEHSAAAERRGVLERRLAAAQADERHLSAEAAELDELLADALAETGAADVATLVRRLDDELAQARRDLSALEEAERSAAALAEATTALHDACAGAGFETADQAVAAALAPAELQQRVARIKHHERRLSAVTAVLREPGAAEVAAQPAPDLTALAAAHEVALAALTDAQAAVQRGVSRLARISTLQAELAEQLAAWGPLREELELTSRLAAFAEGKGADNQLQMSLSAYVVAYRLTQVVAAANERLATMSDRRYSLEHSLLRGAGDRRGGLALAVRDDWSGESRDPATLSGGETFVVSLALALGLADVITREAGGADLDTLFVDEGFGSLDADTLDDVLDTLDSLRDGGRVIGVVSHVSEMRDRISAQLVVAKHRTGSAVSVAGV